MSLPFCTSSRTSYLHSVRAKKSYGQHFLINESLAESIVRLAIEKANGKSILEVGPGKGVLTKHLIKNKINFKAVDADRDMIHFLENTYPETKDRLIQGDFLKQRLDQIFAEKEFVLLGNFPYNISSQIVFQAIQYQDHIPWMIGMFQKEMADRIIAPHGSKTYGAISVLTQVYYSGKTVFKVSPGSFSPPPKVNSSVLLFGRKPILPEGVDPKQFRSIVKTSFGQRRKMLRNTLKTWVDDKSVLESALFSKRPEQLSVQNFIDLTLKIQKQ